MIQRNLVQGPRSNVQGPEWTIDVSSTLDLGPWTLDFGPWTLDLMSPDFRRRAMKRIVTVFLASVLLLGTGCNRGPVRSSAEHTPDACAVALAPHKGEGKIDQEIIRLQGEAIKSRDPKRALDRLGWLFVAKARVSYDPGFYKLAEQCAACLESKEDSSAEALLLRGHVLHNLHRLKEAEKVARNLVGTRGLT